MGNFQTHTAALFTLVVARFAASSGLCSSSTPRHPVVLIPGLAGSILEGTLDIPEDIPLPHDRCPRTIVDWTTFWIKRGLMIPNFEECIEYYLCPQWINGTLQNAPGVQIRSPSFGDTYAIDILDPEDAIVGYFAHYYHEMINAFKDVGYVTGTDLFGAGYDWRWFPQDSYILQLQQLVEDAFYNNQEKQVDLITHSLGGTLSYVFLKTMTEEWKEKFLRQWITLGSPWIGAMDAVAALLSGDNFELPVPPITYRDTERNMEAIYSLLPNAQFWGNDVLVTTPTRNYTAMDYDELWKSAGIEHGVELTDKAFKFCGNLSFPASRTSTLKHKCLYASGMETAEVLEYKNDLWDKQPKKIMGDGDGTVNEKSLAQTCKNWVNDGRDVEVRVYTDVDHVGMISDQRVIDDVLNFVCSA